MGRLLAMSGVLILAAGLTQARAEEEFPWCVKMDAFTKNCAFSNYNECTLVAKNADATCIRNPDYTPPAVTAAKPKSAAGKVAQPPR